MLGHEWGVGAALRYGINLPNQRGPFGTLRQMRVAKHLGRMADSPSAEKRSARFCIAAVRVTQSAKRKALNIEYGMYFAIT